jgi:hypothetical protein
MQIVTDLVCSLAGAGSRSRPQQKFVQQLLTVWLAVRGRFNFANLSRYSACSERTLRRSFRRAFEWPAFNRGLISALVPASHEVMAALDASFVPKSGKQTPGLGYFYNGCAGCSQKGLEASLVSVVDVTAHTAYALSVRQTPVAPGEQTEPAKVEETRVDAYLHHLRAVREDLPVQVRHVAVDGAFTRRKFVDGVCALELEVVGKLRHDANLRYLYEGPQKPRGRPRQYDGKVCWSDLDWTHWHCEGEVEPGVQLYSAVLFHVTLCRLVQVALLQPDKPGKVDRRKADKPRYVLLFSTDVSLSGQQIVRYYKARYQIEFLFRDAKQGTGLNDCQARDARALHFHWNAALCALNLAKWQEAQRTAAHWPHGRTGFSLASCKQRQSNEHLLQVFSQSLGLEWSWVKSQSCYDQLCNYGAIRL